MPELVGYIVLFVAIGVGFIFVHLLVGKLIRPERPHADKLTIYECGEPTIGSAWIQFDLRFYVVALLFVIFDVEVAFFFPWAVVFGKTAELGQANLAQERRVELNRELNPVLLSELQALQRLGEQRTPAQEQRLRVLEGTLATAPDAATNAAAARNLALIAFIDILVFFGVLLVGFAYLWKRGDLTWVRSITAVPQPAAAPPLPPARPNLAAVHS